MEQIDWSKAPEGATHYLPRGVADNNACWYIIRDNDMAVMRAGVDNDDWTWRRIDEYDRTHFIPAAIPRPTTWTGAGLPPVGTVCEVDHDGWRPCEVFAHKAEGERNVDVLFSYVRDNGLESWNWYDSPARFRPILTREQIAAEEREKAADELCETIVEHYGAPKMSEHYLGLARALIEAGYRKVDPAK